MYATSATPLNNTSLLESRESYQKKILWTEIVKPTSVETMLNAKQFWWLTDRTRQDELTHRTAYAAGNFPATKKSRSFNSY